MSHRREGSSSRLEGSPSALRQRLDPLMHCVANKRTTRANDVEDYRKPPWILLGVVSAGRRSRIARTFLKSFVIRGKSSVPVPEELNYTIIVR